MRLLHYINEENELEKIAPILKKECSQILKVMKKDVFLYRGMKKGGEPFIERVPRTDRTPLDTSTTMHDIMNEYFKEKFGWAARSEGLFCTTSPSQARFYGDVYIIFPVNGYKFIWSPLVHDLFDKQNKFIKSFMKDRAGTKSDLHAFIDMSQTNSREIKEDVFSMLDNLKYTDKSLQKSIIFNSEVMVKCNKYYAINKNKYYAFNKKYISTTTAFGFTQLELTQLGL